MKILLADDDPATLSFVKRALEGDGHEVTVVEDGSAALGLLSSGANQFAMMIADVDMPGLDGISLCQRAIALDAAMPILLMSAHHAELERATGLGDGRYEFLLKPFTLEDIRAAVRRITG